MEEKAERGTGIGSTVAGTDSGSGMGEGNMEARLPSLIFMGTPDFAVPSLRTLFQAGADIRLVVTQPDRPSGRGKKLSPPPVKVLAEALGLPVYQPERMRDPAVLDHVRSFHSDCAAVVAYGQLLPQAFLDSLPLGALNVHASLLPRFRGAAPMQRAILAGDAVTGVSIMLLDAGMDTGPVLARSEISILAEDNLGSLHDKLAQLGADLLRETLVEWKRGRLHPVPQENHLATYAPPLAKGEWRIDWSLPAERIVRVIRAFDPFPGAYGFFLGKRLKCFQAFLLDWKEGEGMPGEVAGCTEKGLVVWAKDRRAVCIGELQWEGQRRMTAGEFMRGRPMPPGSRLE